MTTEPDYRDTVFLPQTTFPMRGDLPKREPAILAHWDAIDLSHRLRADSQGRPPFTLHDGPPYANGHLHIGHALNKVLKDVVNRAHQMAGQDACYIPGWDCHGLPIEWKIEEEYRAAGRDKDAVPILQFRAECRAYAERWMAVQAAEFRRLGVEGDFAHRYATMDRDSEAVIAGEIGKFLLNGELYRGLRPVMWSPVEKTALAEAEVDYHDKISETVYVRCPVIRGDAAQGASLVYWTTTPWTVPGTRAVTYGPGLDYAILRVEGAAGGSLAKLHEKLVVALPLLPQFCDAAGITLHHVLQVIKGDELAGTVCAHPLRGQGYEMELPTVPGEYVTADQGTGFVPNAPAHGEEDFRIARENGVEIPETVGPDGAYLAHVPLFAGLHVFKATKPVAAALTAAGTLVAQGKITHSYPHSWRSKAPLIWRATPQWFIRMDGPTRIRERALEAIAQTRFIPEAGRTRLASMIAARPDWCVSRQRAWGVPIPVFVERATGEPLRDPAILARVVAAFREEGADAWYSSPPERFLGNRDPALYEQVMDIVDVWFESGSTHAFVLQARGLPFPADLYLEGSDQHRGWFHSSLLESIGSNGHVPFRAVLTHGFVLDEQGRKMSKSLGNVTAPQSVCDQYGADVLRLWIMTSDTADDLRIGPEILKQQAELYRRLRNTLRWLLGSLAGWTEQERIDPTAMPELERWVLHCLAELDEMVRTAVQSHDWTGVIPAIHAFCAADLSAFYFDIRKDALYCDRPDSPRRRAARTVLDALHRCLTAWLAPVLVFTAEEAWTARHGAAGSVHLQLFPTIPSEWRDDALAAQWASLREARSHVTSGLEAARLQKWIGSSLQAALILPPSLSDLLDHEGWAELAIVSAVSAARADGTPPEPGTAIGTVLPNGETVWVEKAPGTKCARCWRVLPEVGTVPAHPALCLRCTDAVESGLTTQAAA